MNTSRARPPTSGLWAREPAKQAARLEKLLQADRVIAGLNGPEAVKQGVAGLLGWPGAKRLDDPGKALFLRSYLLQQSLQPYWDALSHDLLRHSHQEHKPFLIFKGQALAHVLYPEPALRARSDLDVLVPAEHRQAWEKWLQENDFQPIPSRQGRWVSQQNAFVKPVPGGRRLLVDLHWEINNRTEFHRRLPFSRLHRASVQYADGAHTLPTLSPVDALQLAVFHYFAHRPEDRKHLWLYDMALLWPRQDERSPAILAEAEFLPEMHGLLERMQRRLERVFPQQDFASLTENSAAGAADVAVFLPYSDRRRRKLVDFWQRWKHQPSWQARSGLVTDYLFQPRAYVQQRFGLTHPWQAWFFYPLMWLSDLWRLCKRRSNGTEQDKDAQ